MRRDPDASARRRPRGRTAWLGAWLLAVGLAPAAAQAAIDASGKPQTGVASYYGAGQAGKTTASGAKFSPNKMTAASPTLPLGAKAKVTNRETGKTVHVTITDRGPYAKHRILDVSPKAARKLGMKHDGVAKVKVQPLREPHKG